MAVCCSDCLSVALMDAHEQIRIVEESLGDGVTLAEVARRHAVSWAKLYEWRYQYWYGLGCWYSIYAPFECLTQGGAVLRSSNFLPDQTCELMGAQSNYSATNFDWTSRCTNETFNIARISSKSRVICKMSFKLDTE